MDEFDVGAWAMVQWIYNTSGYKFAEIAYGKDHHPSYLHEKANMWADSPARAMGYLGNEQRKRIAAAVRLERLPALGLADY
jgi:hypothetical protein